jgi:hypothetical protein
MNTAAARGLGVGVFVFISVLAQVARGEVYEVALPVTGTYHYLQTRDFSFDLGVRLQEVHSVEFRAEGSILSVLTGPAGGPYEPIGGTFVAALLRDGLLSTTAHTPPAGKETYPDPEPFSGSGTFNQQTWAFLVDGTAEGHVYMAGGEWHTGSAGGGQGILTSATLVIDATPVPEAGVGALVCVGAVGLLRRRR